MKRVATLALLLASFLGSLHASAQPIEPEYRELTLEDGSTLAYAVALPEGFDASKYYPLLLAMPPGPQNREMVRAGLDRYWGRQATSRGWVVVSPVAPEGQLFFRGGERFLPALIRRLRIDFRIEENRIHLAGASNGGLSAFRIAIAQPGEFRSLTVLPGYPPTDEDFAGLAKLSGMTIHLFVGGEDRAWLEQTERTAKQLGELGIACSKTVLPGEGHAPPSLDGDPVMTLLEKIRAASHPAPGPEADVAFALDDLHDAAAKADEDRYFGRFSPEGVFLGTDAKERWTLEAFRAFGMPYFHRDSAWIYVPQSRHVTIAPGGDVAWFDEALFNTHYGECRGTGALRRITGEWKIAQYNLMLPVPNELAGRLVEMIRGEGNAALGTTTIYLVRHAEKASHPGDADPPLSEEGQARAAALDRTLASIPLTAIFVSQFRRTGETVARVAESKGIRPAVIDARQVSKLVETIRSEHPGASVLVCGHSNTVPAIIAALGVGEKVAIGEEDYDDLFMVTLDAGDEVTLRHLHYGPPPSR